MAVDQMDRAISHGDPSPVDGIGRGVGPAEHAMSAPPERVAAATSALVRSVVAVIPGLLRHALRTAGGLVSWIGDLAVRMGTPRTTKESAMTDEHAKGAITDAKGKVEETAGRVTGNKEQELHGKATQLQGEAQKGLGDLQDATRDDKR